MTLIRESWTDTGRRVGREGQVTVGQEGGAGYKSLGTGQPGQWPHAADSYPSCITSSLMQNVFIYEELIGIIYS